MGYYLDGIASPIRWSKYLRTTFLSCFKSLLVNSVSISKNGRLGGGPLGSSLFSIGLTETKMPSRWSWATASRFFRASNPNESANLRINEKIKYLCYTLTNSVILKYFGRYMLTIYYLLANSLRWTNSPVLRLITFSPWICLNSLNLIIRAWIIVLAELTLLFSRAFPNVAFMISPENHYNDEHNLWHFGGWKFR